MHITLQQFEGPFDLLLSLIEDQKLDVSLISLTQVVDQYLKIIKEQNPSIREKSEFILMASRLVYLKACMLAHIHVPSEEVPEGNIVEQLLTYKQYKDAAIHLQQIFSEKPQMQGRLIQKEVTYTWPAHAHAAMMLDTYLGAVRQLKKMLIPKKSVRPTMTLKEAHAKLAEKLSPQSTKFSEMISDSSDAAHVSVYFLALLHMIATKQADYDQAGLFCDIMVRRYAHT